jgi:type I site-specific restriction-modification system R (restriction) subunit
MISSNLNAGSPTRDGQEGNRSDFRGCRKQRKQGGWDNFASTWYRTELINYYLCYAALSREELRNPLIILVSEINLFVDQTYHRLKRFAGSISHSAERVTSTPRLLELLKSNDEKVLLTTIQRLFSIRDQGSFTRDNIIFVGYDIHVTSGAISEAIRGMFPNAVFILFTSAALPTAEMSAVFGELISKYDFRRAIDEKVASPVHFEQRSTSAETCETHEELDVDLLSKVRSPEYVRAVATDLVSHFENRNSEVAGKAIIITPNIFSQTHSSQRSSH